MGQSKMSYIKSLKDILLERDKKLCSRLDEIEKQARAEGMLTMLEDGFVKAARGLTSIEEVLRVTQE